MFTVSIITTSLNSEKTIKDTINSVNQQTFKNIEHIFIDGNSIDNTIKIIKDNKQKNSILISEKDNGIYDAMNKGIKLSKGEIIFILNSDDTFYNNSIVQNVINIFTKNIDLELIYGNLIYTKDKDVVRKWKSGNFKPGSFLKGWCPPHPSFIVKKRIYEKYGLFNLSYKFAADLEIMYRFLEKFKCKHYYFDEYIIDMKIGGVSNKNLINIIKQNYENIKIFNNDDDFNLLKFLYYKFKHRYNQFIK